MKRLISLVLFVCLLVVGFLLFSNRKKDYEISYNKDDFAITEKFAKDKNNYTFSLVYNDTKFDFAINHKYTKRRKLINKINFQNDDDNLCVSINVFDNDLPAICYKDKVYYDAYLGGLFEEKEAKKIDTVSQIDVYNNNYNYYIWNGYGLSDILKNKDFNFLKKESYDNPLSYQLHNKLLIADYDAEREFSKFYVFDASNNKIDELTFDFKISFNSYFMGDYDDLIYLFDKKNKVQYSVNLEKKELKIVSDNEGAVIYRDGWDNIGLNKLVYNDIYFENTNLVNYTLEKDDLYYGYQNSDIKIKFDENDITAILDVDNDDVFYLKKDSLYKYNLKEGKTLLLSYFEWNFSYSNKIFIFD